MDDTAIIKTSKLGFQWETADPFLFCVHHLDFYPRGNDKLGPDELLSGRNIGNDFVAKNGWRMYHGDTVPGFPVHPHRGFETITFVLQGLVDHADSNGAAGRYGNRDVQWMTAGSGLQHSEMFPLLNSDRDNTFELFQIWLNLPAAKKFAKPGYKMLWGESVPEIKFKDKNNRNIKIDLVAGTYENIKAPEPASDSWAADPDNHVNIWHITMEKNAGWEIPITNENVTRNLYFFEGEKILLNNSPTEAAIMVGLDANKKIVVKNGEKAARLLMLQGRPINEPVEQYGPFVMNNMAEIRQAFSDYRDTQFGGWPWPRHDMVHGKTNGRFAKFADGTETVK